MTSGNDIADDANEVYAYMTIFANNSHGNISMRLAWRSLSNVFNKMAAAYLVMITQARRSVAYQ